MCALVAIFNPIDSFYAHVADQLQTFVVVPYCKSLKNNLVICYRSLSNSNAIVDEFHVVMYLISSRIPRAAAMQLGYFNFRCIFWSGGHPHANRLRINLTAL